MTIMKEMATEALKKKRKMSKNRKRAWKKTDVDDVEEFLDEKRFNQRIGGPVSEKEDKDLFFIDKVVEDSSTDRADTKRRKRGSKPLRCHALLQPDPTIKAVRTKHNVIKKKNILKKRCPAVRDRIENGLSTAKEKMAKFHRWKVVNGRRRKFIESHSLRTGSCDLWAEHDINAVPDGMDEHFWEKTKQKRVKVPKRQKPSEVSAVEVVHPGASYNPGYEEHQELINEAAMIEMKKIKKNMKIERAVRVPSSAVAPTTENWMKEMSAGILQQDDSSGEEGTGDIDQLSLNPPVQRDKKKTKKQRRKENQQHIKEKRGKQLKESRKKENEFNRIKSLRKEIANTDKIHKEKMKVKAIKREMNKTRTKRLGRSVYEEADPALKLSEELEGSLRTLKPEGNLLEDRFKSLQKRNMIEAKQKLEIKKKRVQKKRKIKSYERRGHRNITL